MVAKTRSSAMWLGLWVVQMMKSAIVSTGLQMIGIFVASL